MRALKGAPLAAAGSLLHWQTALTLCIALIVSAVSLRYRYWECGRPFGSRASTARAAVIIILTAVVAAGLGSAPSTAVSFSIAVFLPALLCANRLGSGERELHVTEHSSWYAVISLGSTILLGWLESQMATDRVNWCDRQMQAFPGIVGNPDEIARVAEHVYENLTHLNSSERRRQELRADYDDIDRAITLARQSMGWFGDADEVGKQCHIAKEALYGMLTRAYNWGFTKTQLMPGQPDQPGSGYRARSVL